MMYKTEPHNMKLLEKLRAMNIKRQAQWPGGNNIDEGFRAVELAGETGELCNLIKKMIRLKRGIKGTKEDYSVLVGMIEEEIGDVMVCLDLVGMQFAEPISLKDGKGGVVRQADPATETNDLCDVSNWLVACVGNICGNLSLGITDTLRSDLATAYLALDDVAAALRIDLMRATQMKFNMTSRKHGFDVLWEG